jgi:RNA polymerase sigma-54 factor
MFWRIPARKKISQSCKSSFMDSSGLRRPFCGSAPGRRRNTIRLSRVPARNEIETLDFFLCDQLSRLSPGKELSTLCTGLIGCWTAGAFLDSGDLDNYRRCLGDRSQRLDEALSLLQSLEPAGVGARDIRECLLLQLRRAVSGGDETARLAVSVLEGYMDELSRNQLRSIARALDVVARRGGGGQRAHRRAEALPRYRFYRAQPGEYVIPDAFCIPNGKGFEIVFNDCFQPEIGINPYYWSC